MTARRARLVPHLPPALSAGGFERQYLETAWALAATPAARGWECRPLDLAAEENLDLLHVFGATGAISAWLPHLGERTLVVSALTGSAVFDPRRHAVKAVHARMLNRLRAKSPHEEVRRVMTRADAVLVLNAAEEKYVRATFGPPHVYVVPNGVHDSFRDADPELFAAETGLRDYVLFVGSLAPRKNPLLLARACVELGQRLVLVGPRALQHPAYDAQLQRLLADHRQLLVHLGPRRHHDPLLASAYAGARLFCLPSDEETQPLAVMEALAAGAPAAVGDRTYAAQAPFSALPRLPLDNPHDFTEALRMSLARPEPTGLAAAYSWRSVAELVLSAYDAAAAH